MFRFRLRSLLSSVGTCTLVAGLSCGPKSSGPGDDGGTTPPEACTEIGCQNGLVVRVTPTTAWPHGGYRFTIDADGETTTCTGTLPLPACGTPAMTCDASGITIVESGCALDPAEHAFGDITLESTPQSVSIEITLDDEPIASRSWTPQYQTVQPNGPGCPPTCTTATVDLPLTFE